MTAIAQQFVHGYSSGHTLIAGSGRLSPRDADLITRLSDLSGGLASGLRFESYLTCYPLPTEEYFAIARTWPDYDAPRSGCVITHTILVPLETWRSCVNVKGIDRLFRRPSSDNKESFRSPLNLNMSPEVGCAEISIPESGAALAFVDKYFGKAIRPIVWFDAEGPEKLFWHILQNLWPKLRATFSCCTFSLQPRTRDDAAFDLLFAPTAVYSRFSKLPRENQITTIEVRKTPVDSLEVWCRHWAATFWGRMPNSPSPLQQLPLWNELGDEPIDIRKLFLVHELLERSHKSPTAGVGAIDVIESLARDAASAVPFKEQVVRDAVSAAASAAEPGEGFKSLKLIDDRLHRESLRLVAGLGRRELLRATRALAIKAPNEGIHALDEQQYPLQRAVANDCFVDGILEGLASLASNSPSQLVGLRDHVHVATELLRREPRFIISYLGFGGDGGKTWLNDWLEAAQEPEILRSVRLPLVSILLDSADNDLVSRVLRDIPRDNVFGALQLLESKSDHFENRDLKKIAIERIATVHPELVREYVTNTPTWSAGIAALTAATYTLNRKGFLELLDSSTLSGPRHAETLAAMLDSAAGDHFPFWLTEMVSEDLRVVKELFDNESNSKIVASAFSRVIAGVQNIPLARVPEVLRAIERSNRFKNRAEVVTAVSKSALRLHFSGEETESIRSFLQSEAFSGWLGSIAESELSSVFQSIKSEDVDRAWSWLAQAPNVLYERRAMMLASLCDQLLKRFRNQFSENWENAAKELLRRVNHHGDNASRLEINGKMLRLAFDNVKQHLGQIVVMTFPDVYSVAVQESHPPTFLAALFGWYDWDKAKDLRTTLVESFLSSSWAPGDLAITARNTNILSKVFKRLHRRRDGERYLKAMYEDLSSRRDPQLKPLRDHLRGLLDNPSFQEDWD